VAERRTVDGEAVHRLRELDSRIGAQERSLRQFGAPLWETSNIRDGRDAIQRAITSLEARDYGRYKMNSREAYEHLLLVRSGTRQVDRDRQEVVEIEAHWELEHEAEVPEDDDSVRRGDRVHRVRTYRKWKGEPVKAHLARNPPSGRSARESKR
jgi:hypothetical protein